MDHCPEHSGFEEKLNNIEGFVKDIHKEVKTMTNPSNGIYSRVGKLESFRSALKWTAGIFIGSGSLYGLIMLIMTLIERSAR